MLEAARERGFLGPGEIEGQIEHALGFSAALGDPAPASALDLGSGGGVPGLVLASRWPRTRWVLLDSSRRRYDFLAEAVGHLGWSERLEVICQRAETAAHEESLRGRFEVVTARGFGPPAVVAECGGAFLAPGGRLVVSDPPAGPSRWPAEDLARLGLVPASTEGGFHYQVLTRTGTFPDGYPRRIGVPAKRPLF